METATRLCEKCGAEVFADASEKLCTACLFETALDLITNSGPEEDDPTSSRGGTTQAPPAKRLADFGDYELLEEIARGGQGVVYRARQKSLNRIVALKIIRLGPWATATHVKRFRLEAEAAARLEHSCIVPIYEIGERDGSCYFSMRFIEGGQLDVVARRNPISIRRAAELIAKLARTVHHAHERGILHRDIKPGNILLDTEGEPHLTDFGLARLVRTENDMTRTSEFLGTPSYMAPEQARGDNAAVTRATDVYGLGAVLYQMLTGNPPFIERTTYETTRLLLETEPRQPRLLNPRVDRDLATICLKCLEKDRQRRYASALALAEDLEHWLKREPIRARPSGVLTRGRKWMRRNPAIAVLGGLVLILSAGMSAVVWKSGLVHHAPKTGIAVLPFENLSNDREDASFADGVQDDLLTKLAKIADLRVISRTSVMEYRGKHNAREIGNALGVSHVLEGSVRKTGAWLHINAQLIDTRSDSHLWAESYDRDLKDVFNIQSEIAQKVAEQLHAKISSAGKQAIEQPPTADLTAFDLYSRAKNLVLAWSYIPNETGNLLQAADLLNEAVAHDPSYFQAYCQLASIHDYIYFFGFDRTRARLTLAEAAIQAAFRLRPDAGEAHLARAAHLYRGYLDYEGALAQIQIARQTLPNDPEVFALQGSIQRRQGRQHDALRNFERAVALDPRNVFMLVQTSLSYDLLRRYADEAAILDRVLSIQPNDMQAKVSRTLVEYDWKADTRPLRTLINQLRAKDPAAIQNVADGWLTCALAEHDANAAADALAMMGENSFGNETIKFSPRFVEGLIARMTRDDRKARLAFTAARVEQEKILQSQPNYAPALCVLGLIDAGLGRKEQAVREGRRAVELLPVEKDAINGTRMMVHLATTAAWVGDKDLACKQLALAIQYPNSPSYGDLKLLPWWDPLRGDPCFEKIVTSLAPK